MIATLEPLSERVREQAADAAEGALRTAAAAMRSGGQDLAQVERHVLGDVRRRGQIVLGAALQAMGNGKTTSHRPCACGRSERYVSDRGKPFQTLLGPVTIRRAYYHCRHGGRGEFPLDRAMGVEGTSLTPGVQEGVAWVDVEVAYGRATQFLERTLGLRLSQDTHETLSGRLGEAVQAQEIQRTRRAWERLGAAEQFYVTCDGLKVNTDEGWREPKRGAVFRAARGPDGEPVRGPTRYAGHLEEAEAFGERLWPLADAAGVEQAQPVIALGDGAPWIWNLADVHFPQAVQIVDVYPAVERLAEVARRRWGEDAEKGRAWLARRQGALYDGKISAVLRSLRALPARRKELREIIRKAIGYFRENRHRMRYDDFRAKGYFIASGVVEAGGKHIVAQRFKQSGMRWSRDGFLRLLHLRLSILNGDWDDFARSHFPKLVNSPATYF